MRNIEVIRRERNMTQRQFGQLVGIDASYICNAEKNGQLYENHRRRIAEKLELADGGKTLLEEFETGMGVM